MKNTLVSPRRLAHWFRLFRQHNRPAYQAAALARYFADHRRSQLPKAA